MISCLTLFQEPPSSFFPVRQIYICSCLELCSWTDFTVTTASQSAASLRHHLLSGKKKKPPAQSLTAFLFLAYLLLIMLSIACIGVGSDTPQASFKPNGSSLRRCFCRALRSRLFSASVISIHLPRLSSAPACAI